MTREINEEKLMSDAVELVQTLFTTAKDNLDGSAGPVENPAREYVTPAVLAASGILQGLLGAVDDVLEARLLKAEGWSN